MRTSFPVVVACWLIMAGGGITPVHAISAADARTQSFKLQSEGMRLYREGKYREATKAFQQVVNLNLNSFMAYYYLGASLLAERRYSEAIEPLRVALDLQPDYVQAHMALGNAYLKQGDTSEARAEYLRALDLQPNYAAAYTGLGEMFESTGRDDEAERQYRRALEINVAYAEAYVRLGDLFLRQNRADDAIDLFLKAIAIKPGFSKGYTRLGSAYARQHLYDEAIAAGRKSQALAPRDPDPYVALARVYLDLESHIRAEVAIQAALAEDHDHPAAHLVLSDLKRVRGDFAAAVEVLEGLHERGIEDAQMRRAVAEALEQARAAARRHETLQEAVRDPYGGPASLVALARFLSGQGAHGRAAVLLQDAIIMMAADPTHELTDDAVDGSIGDPTPEAAGETTGEPAVDPTVGPPVELLFETGLELLAARRYPAAIESFEEVASETPGEGLNDTLSEAARFNIGVAQASMGLNEAAAGSFRAYLRARPDDARAHLYLGNAYFRLKRTNDARAAYVAFLERSGSMPEALRIRRILENLDRLTPSGGPTAEGPSPGGAAEGVR